MFSKALSVSALTLSVVAISLSAGCFKKEAPAVTTPEATAPVSVVGTWVAPAEGETAATTITFAADNTFTVDTDGAEGAEIAGKYTATDAQVVLTAETPATPECTAAGTYTFTVENGAVKFVAAQEDACSVRSAALAHTFSKH